MKIHQACPISSQHKRGSWAPSNADASGTYDLDADVAPYSNVPLSFPNGKMQMKESFGVKERHDGSRLASEAECYGAIKA
jgi:hypothetical protein